MDRNIEDYMSAHERMGEILAKDMWTKCISFHDGTRERNRIDKLLTQIRVMIRRIENGLGIYKSDKDLFILKNQANDIMNASQNKMEIDIEKRHRPIHIIYDDKAFINRTEHLIPDDVALALSWGPKFTFPFLVDQHNIDKYMAQLDYTIEKTVPIAAQDLVYKEITGHLASDDQIIYDEQLKWLLFLNYRTQSFLKKHPDIIPALADKGKVVVLISVEEYRRKTFEHLDDQLHYEKIDSDPLVSLVRSEKEIIGFLKNNKATRDLVGPYQENCMGLPKFYATIKIHKENKIRPITSNAGFTVGATLNKFFNKILGVIFPPRNIHSKNAKQVKDDIVKLKIDSDDILVSYDAISMFTSIPTELIIGIITNESDTFGRHFDLSAELTFRIANFLLNECVFFTAFDQIYRQKHGIPMGGAISPICCRLVMDYIMDKVLTIIPAPKYMSVYVDDTFFVLRDEEAVPTLNALNSINQHIQFTCELEIAGTLNFLNLTLFRGLNRISTNWFKKPIASDRLLNYFSSHKRSTILNTAKQFIRTIVELSECNLFQENRAKIIHTLRVNCFPESLIIRLLHESYTLMKPFPMPSEKGGDYISFPHQINNGAIKGIIRQYKNSNSVLAESIKNNKINHIKLHKTRTPVEVRTNLIAVVECQCKLKVKIETTRFNETGKMLVDRLISINKKCVDNFHAFCKISYRQGLHNRQQTLKLLNFLQWRERDRLHGTSFQFPNKYVRRFIEKRNYKIK